MISIIIPTYNRTVRLKAIINHINKTSLYRDYEIVVVNDGGDNVDDCGADIVINQENKGPASARNAGAAAASGDSLLFIGDDIYLDPLSLLYIAKINKEYPESCIQGYVKWHPDVETEFMYFLTEVSGIQSNFNSIHPENTSTRRIDGFGITTCFFIPKQQFEVSGGFNENFKAAAWEDIEFCARVHRLGIKTYFSSKILAYHYHPYTIDGYFSRQIKEGNWRVEYVVTDPTVSAHLIRPENLRETINLSELKARAKAFENSAIDREDFINVKRAIWTEALLSASVIGIQEELNRRGGMYLGFFHLHSGKQVAMLASLIKAARDKEYGYILHNVEWLQKENETNWAIWAICSEAYIIVGNADKALTCAKKAASIAPDQAWPKSLLSRIKVSL